MRLWWQTQNRIKVEPNLTQFHSVEKVMTAFNFSLRFLCVKYDVSYLNTRVCQFRKSPARKIHTRFLSVRRDWERTDRPTHIFTMYSIWLHWKVEANLSLSGHSANVKCWTENGEEEKNWCFALKWKRDSIRLGAYSSACSLSLKHIEIGFTELNCYSLWENWRTEMNANRCLQQMNGKLNILNWSDVSLVLGINAPRHIHTIAHTHTRITKSLWTRRKLRDKGLF